MKKIYLIAVVLVLTACGTPVPKEKTDAMPAAPAPGQVQKADPPTSDAFGETKEKNDDDIAVPPTVIEQELPADEFADPITEEVLPEGLSHVEAGMVDYASCAAAGGDIAGTSCTTFDGRVFTSTN